jgi:hypothetical protein
VDAARAAITADDDRGDGKFIATVDSILLGGTSFNTVLTAGARRYKALPIRMMSRHEVVGPAAHEATHSSCAE